MSCFHFVHFLLFPIFQWWTEFCLETFTYMTTLNYRYLLIHNDVTNRRPTKMHTTTTAITTTTTPTCQLWRQSNNVTASRGIRNSVFFFVPCVVRELFLVREHSIQNKRLKCVCFLFFFLICPTMTFSNSKKGGSSCYVIGVLQQKQQYGVFSSLRRTLGGLRTVKNGSLKRYTELIHNLYCLAIIGNILVALQWSDNNILITLPMNSIWVNVSLILVENYYY